jgi:hypothetical protein
MNEKGVFRRSSSQIETLQLPPPDSRDKETHVVDKSAAPDVDVFTVKSVLKELDDIMSNSILGCESLCPSQQLSGINSSLFDGETDMYKHVACLR